MIWLIDSRDRVHSRKRYVWSWANDDVNAYREAWQIVLNAEVREHNREDYAYLRDQDMPDSVDDTLAVTELAETFDSFWAMYGWTFTMMDNDDPAADIEFMPHGAPATPCFDPVTWS